MKEYEAIKMMKDPESKLKLSSDMLSEVKEWAVGKEYEVTLKVRQTEAEVKGEDTVCAEFEVVSAKKAGNSNKY